jgi:glycerophosphoryl diester phosphodiesterase
MRRARRGEPRGNCRICPVGSDERIPTLTDILELVDGQVPILIEIKDQSGAIGEGEDQLERAVAEDLRGTTPGRWR